MSAVVWAMFAEWLFRPCGEWAPHMHGTCVAGYAPCACTRRHWHRGWHHSPDGHSWLVTHEPNGWKIVQSSYRSPR